ncbi:MAG TPA: lysine--tRNA ligase [Candidatus Saccharimonadia bacterium]|nr:lysine--tRNA ligase [Candidatus Saccharimonadia bacterium]
MTTPHNDWLDQLVDQINVARPAGEIIVSSGHSPSGVYHVGTLREIMTANAIAWALRRAGRKARHVDFVDDFDAFRKVPTVVPESWSQYLGRPLALVPDPFDCHVSYGQHFLSELQGGLGQLGCLPDETISGYENYRSGALIEQIAASLDHLDEARTILTEVGGRQLDEHWAPVQIMDEQQNLRTLHFAGWNDATRQVMWRDKAGQTGSVGLDEGRVKLDWRLDWPARWAKWGVGVEPFGRDHATKGGSYETGKVLVERIFGGHAPLPVPYEFINSLGQTKKMSKSSGDVLTPDGALQVMPPEILRYFVVHPRPSRTLTFDPGVGLYNLIDEFTRASMDMTGASVAYARASSGQQVIAAVPFNHLVSVYQAAQQKTEEVRQILERTGYEEAVRDQWPIIERELGFVHAWLNSHAPESVKFVVQSELPHVELSTEQCAALAKLADTIEAEQDLAAQGIHDAIYTAAEVVGIKASLVFQAIYRVILNKDSGPKAGWFLASLDRAWLLERLRASVASR